LPRVLNDDVNLDSDGAKIDIGAVEFQPTNLTVTVSGSPSSASPTGTITYTLTLNSGTGDNNALNVTLSDAVPAHTPFESFPAPTRAVGLSPLRLWAAPAR